MAATSAPSRKCIENEKSAIAYLAHLRTLFSHHDEPVKSWKTLSSEDVKTTGLSETFFSNLKTHLTQGGVINSDTPKRLYYAIQGKLWQETGIYVSEPFGYYVLLVSSATSSPLTFQIESSQKKTESTEEAGVQS